MNLDYKKKDKLLFIEMTEEIDHHIAEKVRRKVDNEITRYMPRKTILDFTRVSFMDSAGIGMIIGRYKMMKLIGGSLELSNVNENIKYHVAYIGEKEDEFFHNNARCFNVKLPNIGPAKAIVYDLKAIRKSIKYIKDNNIKKILEMSGISKIIEIKEAK